MTHKFGMKVPKPVEEALPLDKENRNDLWWKAMQKEMSAVKVAFQILDDDDKQPIGSQYMEMPHCVLNQDGGFLQESMLGDR